MFGRKGVGAGTGSFEGVMTFYGSYHALRAESILKKGGFRVRLIPGPRAISPNCGVALRFDLAKHDEAINLLQKSSVQYEAVHQYPEG